MMKLLIENIKTEVVSISPITYDVLTRKWDEIVVEVNASDYSQTNIPETSEFMLIDGEQTKKIVVESYRIQGNELIIQPKYCQLVSQ